MAVRAATRRSFHSLLSVATSSIAEPPWFATPVDAMEDADSFTVVFHVPSSRAHRKVVVTAGEQSLTLVGSQARGRRQATRHCAFPCPIAAEGIQIVRSGDLLRIRVLKKHVGDALPGWSSSK